MIGALLTLAIFFVMAVISFLVVVVVTVLIVSFAWQLAKITWAMLNSPYQGM